MYCIVSGAGALLVKKYDYEFFVAKYLEYLNEYPEANVVVFDTQIAAGEHIRAKGYNTFTRPALLHVQPPTEIDVVVITR